jgi:hypothetical protein
LLSACRRKTLEELFNNSTKDKKINSPAVYKALNRIVAVEE